MSTAMPPLHTDRLTIRPLIPSDLDEVDRVLSEAWEIPTEERAEMRQDHAAWLQWSIANYQALARLYQPPYGDRAIIRNADGRLIGCVGLVPSMGPFGKLVGFPGATGSPYFVPEFGLYWAIDPAQQRKGYATEAARALLDYCFGELCLARVVATTDFDNERSMGVMRKLGMRILRNDSTDPPWFQVVGVIEHPGSKTD